MKRKLKRVCCALCLEEKKLQRSHIISEFFLRGNTQYYKVGKSGGTQPFSWPLSKRKGEKYKRMQNGYWENKKGLIEKLLCYDCEQKFSKLEDYVKRFLYGRSNPIKLVLERTSEPYFKVDYEKMKLFQMSILWRAHVARGEFFEAVDVGDETSEQLRLKLLNDNPPEESYYPCSLSRVVFSSIIEHDLSLNNGTAEGMYFNPVRKTVGKDNYYTFIFGGCIWCFCLPDSCIPTIFKNCYLRNSGGFWFEESNCDEFIINFSKGVVDSGNLTKLDVLEAAKLSSNHKIN